MKDVLFIKPPMRQQKFYFRIRQYMDFFEKRDCRIRCFLPSPDGSTLLEKLPARVIFMKLCFWFKNLFSFVRDLYASDVVILFPAPTFGFYCLLAKCFRKTVVIEHTVSYIAHRELFAWYPTWLDRMIYRLADLTITHTESMKAGLVEKYQLKDRKVRVLYCVVDLHHFAPKYEKEATELKQLLGIQEKFVVLYHGLHHIWHGFDLILEAADILWPKRKDILFVLMPGAENRHGQERNILHLTESSHYSWQQLPVFLQTADLWISGFRPHERGDRSFGSTLIQAMAMARPIITAPTPEKLRFLVNNQNVYYITPNSSEAVANQILECCGDLEKARRIGQGARETAEAHFSLQKMDDVLYPIVAERAGGNA